MSSWRAFCETVHTVALAIWLGVVVAAGATAAIVFPAMKALSPRLPEYAAYDGEHWPIAGGHIMVPVFLFADIVQFVCALLAALTLVGLLLLVKIPARRPAVILRMLALAVAIASLTSMLLIVTPRFNAAVTQFWDAAKAGDSKAAQIHKAAADDIHPLASKLLSLTAGAVFVALIAGVRSAIAPGGNLSFAPSASRPSGPRYEEPALLKGRKA